MNESVPQSQSSSISLCSLPSIRKRRKTFSVAIIAGACLAAQADAAEIRVCQSGCPYDSIQDAIDSAPEDTTIRILPGIYSESLVIANKRLRLVGAGAAATILDGASDPGSRVITFSCKSARKILLDGMTIMSGYPRAGFGGGGVENANCKVNLENSVITGNAARSGGGIINLGSMTLKNSTVSNNGAIDLGGGGILNSGVLEITETTVSNNSARNGGGGIENAGHLTATNVTIANNSARLGAGLANVAFAKGALTKVRLFHNEATSRGGAIYNVDDLSIVGSTVFSNMAGTMTTGQGGGVYNTDGANLTLRGVLITRNEAVVSGSDGGGLFNADGGVVIADDGTALVNNEPNDCVGEGCL